MHLVGVAFAPVDVRERGAMHDPVGPMSPNESFRGTAVRQICLHGRNAVRVESVCVVDGDYFPAAVPRFKR